MQKSQLTLAMVIVASIATLVATCMIIAFSSCSADTAVAPTPVPTHAHTATPTRTPTVAPKTAIPTHAPLSTPLLGSSLDSFTAKYGPANDHSTPAGGLYHFKRYVGSNLDMLAIAVDLADGGDYARRVDDITVAASDARDTEGTGGYGWTPQTAESMCSAFFPVDAKYISQIAITGGYDKIYGSASLAALFPASAFQDASQNQIAAGTFDVQYLVSSQLVVSCDILIGEQQTK